MRIARGTGSAEQLLTADGDNPEQRAAVRFVLDREAEPHLLTRDIGRIFFGMDVQCAQCHNHPLVDDYLQSDYHGLLAFVAPSYAIAVKDGDKNKTVLAEHAGSDLSFESVFIKGAPHRTGPRAPAKVMIEEPFYLPGDEYEVPPAKEVKSVPKFSRRARLAELATGGDNEAFNRNIANRLWAMMFGRGLVHPLDLHHADNPPSHPELLDKLSEHIAATNFDMRAFLRELALTEAYQRSFDPPVISGAEASSLEAALAAREAAVEKTDQAYADAMESWYLTEEALIPAAAEVDAARKQFVEAKKKADEANKLLGDAQAKLAAKQQVSAPLELAALELKKAAALLPADTSLAETSQQVAARAEKLAGEMAALAKAAEAQAAAAAAPSAALTAAQGTLEAAATKAKPFHDAMREAEQQMLIARRQAAAGRQRRDATAQRLTAATLAAQFIQQQQALAVAAAERKELAAKLEAARTEWNELLTAVAASEAAVTTATQIDEHDVGRPRRGGTTSSTTG